MIREITVKNEGRASGNYSIYVREGSFWNYTGMTFSSRRECNAVVAAIRKSWCRSEELEANIRDEKLGEQRFAETGGM